MRIVESVRNGIFNLQPASFLVCEMFNFIFPAKSAGPLGQRNCPPSTEVNTLEKREAAAAKGQAILELVQRYREKAVPGGR